MNVTNRQFELPLVPPVEEPHSLTELGKKNPEMAKTLRRLMAKSRERREKCDQDSIEGLIARMYQYKLMLEMVEAHDVECARREKLESFYKNFPRFWDDVHTARENTGNLQNTSLSESFGAVLEVLHRMAISEIRPMPTYAKSRRKKTSEKISDLHLGGNPSIPYNDD